MLTKDQIKTIEEVLSKYGEIFYRTSREVNKEHARGYCQGVDFVLMYLGYDIKWDGEKATLLKD